LSPISSHFAYFSFLQNTVAHTLRSSILILMYTHTISQYLTLIKEQKALIDSLRPFDQDQLASLQQRFRINFTQQSNALEGNSLTLSEVKVLVEDGITVWGKTVAEINETLNHASLLDILWTERSDAFVTTQRLLQRHSTLMTGVIESDKIGIWRPIQVFISWSTDVLPAPDTISWLMDDYCAMWRDGPTSLEDIARIHYDLVKIHPYIDGNGRIARLVMNMWLIALWYFPIIIPTVVRNEYIASVNDDHTFDDFYHFLLRQIHENHKDYIRLFQNK